MIVTATYYRVRGDADVPVEVEAECAVVEHPRANSKKCDEELVVVWTEECLAKLQRLGFTADEFDGAIEAIDSAYDCHQVRLAQVTGNQAFFDQRNEVHFAAG